MKKLLTFGIIFLMLLPLALAQYPSTGTGPDVGGEPSGEGLEEPQGIEICHEKIGCKFYDPVRALDLGVQNINPGTQKTNEFETFTVTETTGFKVDAEQYIFVFVQEDDNYHFVKFDITAVLGGSIEFPLYLELTATEMGLSPGQHIIFLVYLEENWARGIVDYPSLVTAPPTTGRGGHVSYGDKTFVFVDVPPAAVPVSPEGSLHIVEGNIVVIIKGKDTPCTEDYVLLEDFMEAAVRVENTISVFNIWDILDPRPDDLELTECGTGEELTPPEGFDILTEAEMQAYLDWWVYESWISTGEEPLPPEDPFDILTEAEMQAYLDWWVYESWISSGGEPIPTTPEASGEISILGDIGRWIKGLFVTPCHPLKAGTVCCQSDTAANVGRISSSTPCPGGTYPTPWCVASDPDCCLTSEGADEDEDGCEKR